MNPELQLRDIHLPAEIGWWPPAYGWWIVCLLILLGCYFLFKHWRSNRALRPLPAPQVCKPALRELQRLEQEYADDPDQLIKELSVLLRRSAISLHGRHRISGLSGDSWLEFLDEQSDSHAFTKHFHKMLTEWPYRETSNASASDLVNAVRRWLHIQQDKRIQQGKRSVGHV